MHTYESFFGCYEYLFTLNVVSCTLLNATAIRKFDVNKWLVCLDFRYVDIKKLLIEAARWVEKIIEKAVSLITSKI